MASKRDRESGAGASGQPPAKKLMTQLEPVKIGPIYSLVMYFQIICDLVFKVFLTRPLPIVKNNRW
jgi:hypothetical protein